MNKHLKRVLSGTLALAVSASFCGILSGTAEGETVKALPLGTYEAETLECDQDQVLWTSVYENTIKGDYSGEGFVYQTNGTITMHVTVDEEAMYSISAKCAQILSTEGRMATISINGADYTFNLPYMDTWTDVNFGVFRLRKGVNKIEFKPQYGYAEYDTITVAEGVLPELKGTGVPCDPDATPETKSLMAYLNSVYGKHVLSGQQEIYGGGHGVQTTIRYDAASGQCVDSNGKVYDIRDEVEAEADDKSKFVWHCWDETGQEYTYDSQNRNYKYNEYDREIKYLKELTGDAPAIRGFDFGSNCPCYQWDDGVTKRMIDWAVNRNGICTASWHINVPTTKASYTMGEPLDFSMTTYSEKTDFVTANVMKEGTMEYEYFRLALDNLAKQFLELQEAGVPVLWRPFHEAEGNGGKDGKGAWFWWAKEGTEVYKELWKYMYTVLTEEYGIHNLIWEQNLYAWSDESAEWYVGDEWVDIVGFDKYDTVYNRHDGKTSGPNEDCNSKVFWSLVDYVNNEKMVCMPENSTIPSVPNMTVEHANWLYFCTWYDEESSPKFISGEDYNDAKTVKATYQSDYCITLSELPKNLYTGFTVGEDTPKPTSKPTETESSTEAEETDIVYGDVNLNGTVEVADAIKLAKSVLGADKLEKEAAVNADVNLDSTVNADDVSLLIKSLAQIVSLPCGEPPQVSGEPPQAS